MSLDRDFVLAGLLQHNYLPVQSARRDEMPPIFDTSQFTPDIAKLLASQHDRRDGYDTVQYKVTRYNGVSRGFSIPHPTPYARLALCVHEHWSHIEYVASNSRSLSRPRRHPDGRVVLFEYGTWSDRTRRELVPAFGRRFVVRTDVSNCFPSIYTHAVPWAIVGLAEAKAHYRDRTLWYNRLDARIRAMKRNETKGLLVGPGSSSLLSEALLARVDQALEGRFTFHRFVDDYSAYCDSEQEAHDFLRCLAEELDKYKLDLNILKTDVVRLPLSTTSRWISELTTAMPRAELLDDYACVSFLNSAICVAEAEPDGSVLKYALRALLSKRLSHSAKAATLRFSANLAYHQSSLLPLLNSLLADTAIDGATLYSSELQAIALENARNRRSDGMAWALFYLLRHRVDLDDNLADEVLASSDCLALCVLWLCATSSQRARIVDFAKGIRKQDLFERDQYWLLLYTLYTSGVLSNPYDGDQTFPVLRNAAVSFVDAGWAAAARASSGQ